MRMIRPALILMLAAQGGAITQDLAAPPPALDQEASDTSRSELVWSPAHPRQGSVVQLQLRLGDAVRMLDDPLVISGSLAGQDLHFEPGVDGLYHALAGIPVGAPSTMVLSVEVSDGVWTERVRANLPVARGVFTSTQLSVDPRFTAPPDSALAVRLAAERDSVRSILARSHQKPRMWRDRFVRPRSTRVTSGYGQRREFNGELRSRHLGADLAGDVGAPVVATNRGVVVLVGDFYYAGSLVYLDHGAGLLTAYLHLSDVLVAVGDTVNRGQMIGRVGASGRVTGPHLHWIARYGSVMVDPLSLVELDLDGW